MTDQERIQIARMIELYLATESYTEEQLKLLLSSYDVASAAIINQLDSMKKSSYAMVRLEALADIARASYSSLMKSLEPVVKDTATHIATDTISTLSKILSWDGKVTNFNNVDLTATQISTLITDAKIEGKTLKEWMGSAFSNDFDSITDTARAGLIRGENPKTVALEFLRGMDEVEESTRRNLETIFLTYAKSSSSSAQDKVYEANKSIVQKVEWTAVLEQGNTKTGRGTCVRCMALDGNTYELDEKKPDIPLHPRCRCMYLPVTKTWAELGIDIPEPEEEYRKYYSLDKEGKRVWEWFEGDYEELWKSKPNSWQDTAIGPRRAELIRMGAVEFSDLVEHDTGKLILIKDLISEVAQPVRGPQMYQPIYTAEGKLGTILTVGICHE